MRRNVQLPRRIDPGRLGKLLSSIVVSRATGCWTVRAQAQHSGRYYFCVGGKRELSYRYIYEMLVGPIPKGFVIDHLCGNPSCMNPLHLEPVTQRQNILRGRAGNQNKGIAYCLRGHPLSGQNLYVYRAGDKVMRQCRTCRALATRRYYERLGRLPQALKGADLIGAIDRYEPQLRP